MEEDLISQFNWFRSVPSLVLPFQQWSRGICVGSECSHIPKTTTTSITHNPVVCMTPRQEHMNQVVCNTAVPRLVVQLKVTWSVPPYHAEMCFDSDMLFLSHSICCASILSSIHVYNLPIPYKNGILFLSLIRNQTRLRLGIVCHSVTI